MLEIGCEVVAGGWDRRQDWQAFAGCAVGAALAGAGWTQVLDGDGVVEVSVRLSDDAEVRELNRNYRHKDRATNILSFPMLTPDEVAGFLPQPGGELLLGDLVLAHETVAGEADAAALALADHVVHLLVHGTLHLLGHDHQDDAAAEAMEALERRILSGLGIADPYRIRPPSGGNGAR